MTTIRYVVTRIERHGFDSPDRVYGIAGATPERYLGAGLPECCVGDVIDIDYDDTEDERGEVVAARLVKSPEA